MLIVDLDQNHFKVWCIDKGFFGGMIFKLAIVSSDYQFDSCLVITFYRFSMNSFTLQQRLQIVQISLSIMFRKTMDRLRTSTHSYLVDIIRIHKDTEKV